MNPSLPLDDDAPDARRAALEADRAIWRLDPDQRLPLAAKIETEDHSAGDKAKVIEFMAMLMANTDIPTK